MKPDTLDQPDKFHIAVLIGIFIAIPDELFSLTMKHFGLVSISKSEEFSMLFLKAPDWRLGVLALPSVTALSSILFYYLLKVIGKEHILLKATIWGMTVNAMTFQIFGVLNGNEYMLQNTLGNYILAVSAGITGFIAGLIARKFV